MGKMLNSAEAGEALGVSRITIYNYVKNNRLPAKRIGLRGEIRVDADDLRRFAEANGMSIMRPDMLEK